MDRMKYAIEMEEVSKTFGSHRAVAGLSLRVPRGSVYGFIGPNGSGKTTTLRMMMRIIHADAGRIVVLGREVGAMTNDRVGYLPEERGLYRQMKVIDLLRFHARLKGHAVSRAEVEQWLERMGLIEWGNRKVETLSKGMSQKVQFLAAVVSMPELLLLDEPFSGLDPINTEVIRETVLGLVKEGTTVLFSTHDMETAEAMCDWILMIHEGRKVLDGTLREIQAGYGSDVAHVRMGWGRDADRRLEAVDGVEQVMDLGNMQELRMRAGADPQEILAQLMCRGRVERFEVCRPSLREIFMRIAGRGES